MRATRRARGRQLKTVRTRVRVSLPVAPAFSSRARPALYPSRSKGPWGWMLCAGAVVGNFTLLLCAPFIFLPRPRLPRGVSISRACGARASPSFFRSPHSWGVWVFIAPTFALVRFCGPWLSPVVSALGVRSLLASVHLSAPTVLDALASFVEPAHALLLSRLRWRACVPQPAAPAPLAAPVAVSVCTVCCLFPHP